MTEQELKRQEEKKFKQTERLIKAVSDLDKRFKKEQADAKKEGTGALSFKNILSTVKGRASTKIRETFSIKNALSLMGMGEGTMIGGLASMREIQKQEKMQEVEKAQKFASGFTKYTEKGRALALIDENKAIAEGVKLYEKRKEIEEEIAKIEADMKAAKELGPGASVGKEAEARLKALKKENEELLKPAAKNKPTKSRLLSPEELENMRESLIRRGDVINRTVTETERATGVPVSTADRSALAAGIRKGMDEELLKLNEEQLNELRKLTKSFEQSEEDRLESRIKSASPSVPEKIKQNAEEKKSDSVFDKLFGGIGDIIKTIKDVLPTAGRALSTGASSVGRLAAAAATNPLTAVAAGGVAATVAATGILATEQAAPLRKAVQENSMLGAMSGDTALASGILDANDDKSPEEIRKQQASEQELLKNAPWYTRMLGIGRTEALSKATAASRPTETVREMQAATLEKNTQRAEELKAKTEKAEGKTPPASIVNNSVVNNTTNQTKISPPVRNIEPSFNSRLKASFV